MAGTPITAGAPSPPQASRTASRRLRVLHVIQNLNYGGMERLIADIARLTDGTRIDTHIMALQYLGRFSEGLEDCATLHLASPMTRASMLWPRALIRQFRAIRPDVVHSHSGVWYKASLAARAAGVPRLVHTEHGRQVPDPWVHRLLDGRAADRTDIVVAVSHALAHKLSGTLVRRPDRIRVIENGVRTDLLRPLPDSGALRRVLGIPAGVPIIGSIGRLEGIKGYEVMVRAYAQLHARMGSAAPPLVIAGDGNERQRLERLAAQTDARAGIHFLGWRDEIRDLHEASTIFTMSSHSEGTSVSLLEAMSAGICPIVTDVGGNAEVLGPALRHRLVPPSDPAMLALAWEDALRHPERRESDAQAARRRVIERFDARTMTESYERLYHGHDPV